MQFVKTSLFIIFLLLSFDTLATNLDLDKAIDAMTSPYKIFIKDWWFFLIPAIFVLCISVDFYYHVSVTVISIVIATCLNVAVIYFGFFS